MSSTPSLSGFIGTGVMGRSMAGHLLKSGRPLSVFTRSKEKAAGLLSAGAAWAESPARLAQSCGVIFSMLGFPKDVEEVYFGPAGLLANSRPGTLLIDMTSSSPGLARRIAEAGSARGLRCLDAPVSGGDLGAREARLSIMVGGAREDFELALPQLQILGKSVVHQGPAGSGQHCKMANQIAIAAGMLGVCESLAYSMKNGLDPKAVLESISNGAAGSWSLSNLAPRMLSGDFAPGFYVKHFIKDMQIALESAQEAGLSTPGLKLALERYRELAAMGFGDEGTQALYKLYS
jgi:3-hydroxyisobutyrate dehydrogenase